MNLDSIETTFLVIGAASAALTLFLAWRAIQLHQLQPECQDLASVQGSPSAVRLDHRFYSAWWLDFSIGDQPLRAVPGPWLGRAHSAIRESGAVQAAFCPSQSRSRLWELRAGDNTVLSVKSQQVHARTTSGVLCVGALLTLGAAVYSVLLISPRRRRAA